VVKAFNHLPAAVLARDLSENGGRRVGFISSNDDTAANEVKILAEQLGFSPILLGRIDEGGRLFQIDGGLILHNLVEWPFK
jgi:8-hydroxy-5-deazaflavin:NADPH oxidoreductase